MLSWDPTTSNLYVELDKITRQREVEVVTISLIFDFYIRERGYL